MVTYNLTVRFYSTSTFIDFLGRFYLVDAKFMSRREPITPYVLYHLKKYSRNPPQISHKLFNLRHASLRNAIEKAFNVF